jgi:hypothetical protein
LGIDLWDDDLMGKEKALRERGKKYKIGHRVYVVQKRRV